MEPVVYGGLSSYGANDIAAMDPDNAATLLVGKKIYHGTDEESGRVFSETPPVIDTQIDLMKTGINTIRSPRTDEKYILWKDWPKHQDISHYRDVHFGDIDEHTE